MNSWLWFVFGAVLLGLELLLPAFYLMFFGAAAFLVGIVAYFFTPSFSVELVLFAAFSAIFVICGRYFKFYKPESQSHPHLNNVMEEYIGREVPLFTAIVQGQGQVKIGDSLWAVTGKDAAEGTKVKLIGVNGQAFEIEKL